LLIGEFAGLELRVDQLAVDGELEATTAGWDEFEALDLLLVGRQKLARQTDGLWLVVSHRAVFQLQIHASLPSAAFLPGPRPLHDAVERACYTA
jgi:hypothetical protein